MLRRWLFFSLFFSLLVLAAAEGERPTTPVAPGAQKDDSSQEASIIEQSLTKVTFDNSGSFVHQQSTRVHVQTDAGVKQWGLLSIPYQSATQTVEIDYVRVRKSDGSVVTTPPDNVQDMDSEITRNAPFYSDLREKHVAVKGLGKGDILEYVTHWQSTKPLVPGQFWFQFNFTHNGIVLDERLEITVPAGREVKVKGTQGTQTATTEGDNRTYTWTYSHLKNVKEPEKDQKKETEAALGRLPGPDVQISSFQTWEEVGRWYWNLQKERVVPTAAIRAKAAELTRGMTDDAAKLHAIFNYVSTQYRYIGIAFGIGRLQPHAADDVLTNNYGDCKDKHTLLASLLEASGITVYPALISATFKLDPDIPSPAQFDHLIGYLPKSKDHEAVWLDTTLEVAPLGYLVPRIRDKTALLVSRDQAIQLMTTPADPPSPSTETFKIDGKLSADGTLVAKVEDSSRGDSEVMIRTAFRQVPQPQWQELVQRISYGLGFAGIVSEITAGTPEKTTEPFRFSYSYNRKDFPDWSNRQLIVPGLPFAMPPLREDAKYPIWLGSATEFVSDSRVELPQGYKPQLPANVDLKYDFAEYHASYADDKGAIIGKRRLLIKLCEVPVAEFEDYKNFVKNMQDDVNRYVQTSSNSRSTISNAAGGPGTQAPTGLRAALAAIQALPASDSDEANRLEIEAREKIAKRDMQEALSLSRRAVSTDPKFTRGWVLLGQVLLTQKETDAGLEAFRKAMAENPREHAIPKLMGLSLMAVSKFEAAVSVWQDYIKANPDDAEGPQNLGRCLSALKRFSGAATAYEDEIRIGGDSEDRQFRLGSAYLLSGEREKGTAMLRKLAEAGPNPGTKNDVAYELAEANADLDDALKFAEKAVETLEKQTYKLDASKLSAQDVETSLVIGMFWDTLGWVHFRLGHLDQAESYLYAAWLLQLQPVVADHLGQVYEHQKKTEKAIHMYRLALSTPVSHIGTWNETRRRLEQLTGNNSAPVPELIRVDPNGDELSQLRSVKLKQLVTEQASAEFFLLFKPDAKVQAVQFISGSERLKSLAPQELEGADFQVALPDRSSARLVRRVTVTCSKGSGCEAVLNSPEWVKSVE